MIRQTSLLAFESLERQAQIYILILQTIRKYGKLTDMEISKKLGFNDPNKIRPRRNELMKKGIIYECEKRECSVTHKVALTWDCLPFPNTPSFPMEKKITINRYLYL
jgi:hypothetical protein